MSSLVCTILSHFLVAYSGKRKLNDIKNRLLTCRETIITLRRCKSRAWYSPHLHHLPRLRALSTLLQQLYDHRWPQATGAWQIYAVKRNKIKRLRMHNRLTNKEAHWLIQAICILLYMTLRNGQSSLKQDGTILLSQPREPSLIQ